MIKQIMVADLGSSHDTTKILKTIGKDYEYIKPVSWKECKEIIDNIVQIKNAKQMKQNGIEKVSNKYKMIRMILIGGSIHLEELIDIAKNKDSEAFMQSQY